MQTATEASVIGSNDAQASGASKNTAPGASKNTSPDASKDAPTRSSAADAFPQATENLATGWPSADWWQQFGSPELNNLMQEAQRANDDLAAAIARVNQADAQVWIAGAPLLPALDVQAGAGRQRQKLSALSPAGAQPQTFSQFTAQAGASYELDFWGKDRAQRASAKFAASASRFERATVELTVMTSVATTFFQAIELRDRLNVAEQDLSTAQTILKDLALEETVGTVTALDVAQQATTVAVLNASIPPLRQQLRQTLDALAVLVGRMPQELPVPEGSLKALSEPRISAGLPSELLARRPDVAAAEANLKAANANIQAARAALFPSIDLTASGGFVSTALSSLISPANRVFALSGTLTQQIFQGGALVGGYRLSRARYSELLADYHKSVLSAFGNVQDALVAAQQSAEQLRRQQDAVEKARRAYEYTEMQLHAGTVNVLTVLNTQTALFNAEDNLVQVRFAHLQALVQLFGALGGGWQDTQARS